MPGYKVYTESSLRWKRLCSSCKTQQTPALSWPSWQAGSLQATGVWLRYSAKLWLVRSPEHLLWTTYVLILTTPCDQAAVLGRKL